MFTGIVTDIGRVRSVRETNRDRRYEVETVWDTAGIDLGASISHAGHVDGLGEVVSITPEGGSHRIVIEAPAPLHRFIAPKGSITVDGVSLTVNGVHERRFDVNIIPHTWNATTLGGLKVGEKVNLEIDMLARYLARWQETA